MLGGVIGGTGRDKQRHGGEQESTVGGIHGERKEESEFGGRKVK